MIYVIKSKISRRSLTNQSEPVIIELDTHRTYTNIDIANAHYKIISKMYNLLASKKTPGYLTSSECVLYKAESLTFNHGVTIKSEKPVIN